MSSRCHYYILRNALFDTLGLCTLSTNPSPNKGGVRANIWHLKAGSSELRNGNPNRRASGPPGWGLEHGAENISC